MSKVTTADLIQANKDEIDTTKWAKFAPLEQETKMKNLIIKAGNKTIEVQVCLDEVIDYNEEYGFTEGDDEFHPMWVGANVMGGIGNGSFFGQVQYDTFNKEFSADCDGNVLYDEIKKALFANFEHEELYTTRTNEKLTCEYEIESDLHCDLVNDALPRIVKFICDFGGEEIKKYKA